MTTFFPPALGRNKKCVHRTKHKDADYDAVKKYQAIIVQ